MVTGVSQYWRAASRKGAVKRLVAGATVIALSLFGAVVLQTGASAAPGDPAISLTKRAPGSVLAGEPVTFTLTASNAGAVPEYNTSFRDVLPRGLTYQAGSARPSDVGEPTVVTDANGVQTLIWRDAFDLQVGATSSITFTAAVNGSLLPVGSVIRNTGQAYASTNPRTVPRFDALGAPVATTGVQSASSAETTTGVSALKVAKAEPSPESKLLRGIHDHPTIYTLTVTNTSQAATNATTVSDYLPAQLEFLGCGQTDNSSSVEYPGAPSLTATPAVGANCPTPVSVSTVANPPADGTVSYPAGVYTKVTWNLGTLAAGQTATIRYVAGVPLRANTLFAGGPTAASLGQTANLDNNTGASTRQSGDAASQTNYVHAAGTYTGALVAGGSAAVVADTAHTVTVNDLRVYKSVAPTSFAAGQVATYTLRIDSGEYTDNSAITITDILPNGVCPLDNVANRVTGAPAECAPAAGFAPSLPYQSVTQNPDGTFTVVFTPIAVPKNGSTVVTYQGRNRTTYTGGSLAGSPPSAGDSFTNQASERGTSTAVAATGFTGTAVVQDSTSATQTTSGGSITKTVGARQVPMDCATTTYGKTEPLFVEGDRVCFEIRVPFSTTNQTQNAVVTDFLPENTSFEAGSVVYPAANTVDPSEVVFDTAGAASGSLSWRVGADVGGGNTEVEAGAIFVVRFSAIVTGSAVGPAPDKPGNIAKLRTTNSLGEAGSLRDGVDFRIAAAPPVGITKGVASVNGAPGTGGTGTAPNIDGVTAREGDVVRFRVDVTNLGTSANGTNVPIGNLILWDVLPVGVRCAQIAAISDSGVCTDPGAATQPTFTGNTTRSAITWTGSAATASDLAPGAVRTLTYDMTVPNGTSVSTSLVNTAAVRSYITRTDIGGTAIHYPLANIDTTVLPADQDTPAASDTSNVVLPNAVVAKGVTSAINETGNVGAEAAPATTTRATIGEQVTFTTSVTVPAHTTVFQGRFTDPLPTGLTLNSATATYRPDAASATTAALPAGVTFSATAPPTITFPTTYDNTTATDQVFTMTITATMVQVVSNQNGVVRTNTATFSSTATATGAALPARTASAAVTDVEPLAGLTKTNNGGTGVSGGQTVTYTLRPSNAAARPPLHDAWVLDCLPSGLTFAAYGTLPAGVTASAPVAGTGANGCPTNFTVLAFNLADLAGGATLNLTYTATVDATATGKTSFINVASLSGNSLAQARTAPTDPGDPAGRQYSAGANSTVTISGATATKSVTPTSATVGQTVTYSTSANLPAGVNFYNLSLIDTLPRGIDPSSVSLVGVECRNADTTACTPASATALTPVAGTASSTVIGWLLGDSGASTQARTVTVTYTARVADVTAAIAGAGFLNRMHVSWDTAARTAPTSSGATFNQASPDATATVTVLEPSVSIVKATTNQHPEPGQSFTYSVAVRNANTASTSTAYGVAVTDTVPTGVVVDPASISGGGTLTGADPTTGGGVISWTVPTLAKNAVTTFTYSAVLAPSATLTAANLVNTARVPSYTSLAGAGRTYTGPQSTATVGAYFPKMTTSKSAPSGTTAFIGESFGWRVVATNTGSGVAYQVGAVDTLPTNWTYDAGSARVSVNGGAAVAVDPTVAAAGGVQTLTWSGLGTLPAGTALSIDYTATPSIAVAALPGVGLSVSQTNTASSSARDATGAPGNLSGSYASGAASAVARIASADLAVVKAVGTAPTAGGSGSWTITVTNAGPDAATGPFVVSDDFAAAGVANVRASGTGWVCSTTNPITCTAPGTLAGGASLPPITVAYDVASTVTGGTALPNTAAVSARSFDPQPANDSGTATATVGTSANIAIAKTLSSTELVAGLPVSYRLTVSNAGPSSAAGPITVRDTLPAGTSFVSATGDGWACQPVNAGVLTCTLPGPLEVGATPEDLLVTVDVPVGRTSSVVNTATAGSATPDPTPADNTSTITTTPVTRADVTIEKTNTTDVLVAGAPVGYRFDVTNNGPSSAAGVRVTDTLPDELTYASFTSTDPNWACSAVAQLVTCTYGVSLVPGTTTVSITAGLAADFDVSERVLNTATVTTTTTDPNPGDNSDDDDSSATASADLSIAKSHTGEVTAGENVTFTLAVRNAGPSNVPGAVTVSDPLPTGLTFVSATGTGWDCDYDADTRLVECVRAAGLLGGADAPAITLIAGVDSGVGASIITNIATVGSETPDPTVTNNSAEDAVTIVTEAELTLTKELTSASPAVAGSTATFTFEAGNAGPSDAVGVSVVDTLPVNMTYVSSTGTGWVCSPTGQVVACSLDAIVAGTSAPTLTITVSIAASTPVVLPASTTTLTNTATIDATTAGTNNDPAPVDVPVIARADLALTKSATTPEVTAGEQVTWQLDVTNTGPSDAAGALTVTDTLPGFQTYVSTTAPWTCAAGAAPATPSVDDHQLVTCTLDAGLAVGDSAPTLTIVAQVDTAAPAGEAVNTAVATSPTPGADGEAEGTVDVVRAAPLTVTKTHTGNGIVGSNLDFGITVRNNGPSVATEVVVTDPLPAGLTFVSATGTDWTCVEAIGTVTCELDGTLAALADSPVLTVTATVEAAAYPGVTNTATVDSTDPALPGTASDDDAVVVDPQAALTLTKEHVGDLVVGQNATYELIVGNAGPTATPGPVVVTDQLPTGLSFVSAIGDGWVCAAPDDATPDPAVVCSRDGALGVDESSVITLTVAVGPLAYPSVVNTATAAGAGSPTATGVDTAPVTPTSALAISKTVQSYADDVATYSIAVTNNGPSDTVDPVVVTDALPDGLRFSSASGTGWDCRASNDDVTCTYDGSIANGATATITLVTDVTANPGQRIENIATVTGGVLSEVTSAPAAFRVGTEVVDGSAGSGSGSIAYTGADPRDAMMLAGLAILLGLMLVGGARTGRRQRRTIGGIG